MREIKFRAQDIASNKWLYGDLRHHKDDVCIFEQGGTKGEQVKAETVGQYIGRIDCEGKPIYEGDIFTLNGKYPKLVKYVDDWHSFCVANLDTIQIHSIQDGLMSVNINNQLQIGGATFRTKSRL